MPVFMQSRKGVLESEPTFTIVPWLIHGRRQCLLPALPSSLLLLMVCRKAAVEQILEGKLALFGGYHQPPSG